MYLAVNQADNIYFMFKLLRQAQSPTTELLLFPPNILHRAPCFLRLFVKKIHHNDRSYLHATQYMLSEENDLIYVPTSFF